MGYGGGMGMGCGMGYGGMMMGGCGSGGCGMSYGGGMMMGGCSTCGSGGYTMGGGMCANGVCSLNGSVAQATGTEATLVVNLPEDATLTIDGEETTSTSANRVFVSPPLRKAKNTSIP